MSESFIRIIAHVVFSTKDRKPYLSDITLRKELYAYLAGIAKVKGGKALCIGGVEDHIHMLLVMPKLEAPVDVFRDMKRAATLWIKKREPSLNQFSWQRGCGAFSVGQGEIAIVQSYIEGQEKRHRKETFKQEFVKFLTKYGFTFDEDTLWG